MTGGEKHGRWPSPQMNPEPNERKKRQKPNSQSVWNRKYGIKEEEEEEEAPRARVQRLAQLVSEYRKGNNINIHDPVPFFFQIQHLPFVLLHPNPPSFSLPLPSIGWQHLVGHMVRQLLQGNMGICGATQRRGGDNTGNVGVFVRGCRWHRGRVMVIFISSVFFFFFFCNSFFTVSDQLKALIPSRILFVSL